MRASRRKSPIRVLGSLVCALVLAACASPSSGVGPQPGSAPVATDRVAPAAAHSLVHDGALLVDVRTPDEYASKHIDGAIDVPLDDVASHDFGATDRPIVLYCQSGQRSAHAAEILRRRGFTRVYVLGPMSAWGP